jgi:hypothetical protein
VTVSPREAELERELAALRQAVRNALADITVRTKFIDERLTALASKAEAKVAS